MIMTKTTKNLSSISSAKRNARVATHACPHGPRNHHTRTHAFTRIIGRILLAVVASLTFHSVANAATFTVTNTNDSGPGSLRQAIEDVNSSSGFDRIIFNIPSSDPNCNATTGVCTIRPQTIFSGVSNLEIDGYTQPGASPNTLAQGTNAVLKIEIKGSREVPGHPAQFAFSLYPGGATLKGLIINNFILGALTANHDNRILGCFIGTDATGTVAVPNSRNEDDAAVTLAGNSSFIGIADVSVGALPADRNLISGNLGHGIRIVDQFTGSSTNSNRIQNNLIGTKADGVSPLGNSVHGIFMRNGTSGHIDENVIANNVIAFNGGIGVNIAHGGVGTSNPPLRNRILSNSIHSNGHLGINLGHHQGGVVSNDSCDGDADNFAPNNSQNHPVITSSSMSGGNYYINGFLNSNPGGTYTLQFFANDACDAFGNGEGKTYLGEITVSDSDCVMNFNASFSAPAGAGQVITATATDSSGNTSGFSSCAPAGAGCLPTDGLVSQYHGENSAYDSQDKNHGTSHDGVFGGGMNFEDGLLGRAFRLDGSDDFVRIPHSSSLNFTNFTLEAWVKTNQPSGTFGFIWSKNATYSGTNDPFALSILPDGRAHGRVGKGDNATEVNVASSVAVNDNNWHHLALTFDGSRLSLYRDGNLDDSQPVPFPLHNNTQDVILGQWAAHAPSALHNYRGLIDELSVHSRALSDSEIAAIHRGGTTGHCQPLIADGDGDGVADDADNCPAVANSDQLNTDGDGQGDACDADDDNDTFSDAVETTEGSDPLNADSTPEVCDGTDNDLNDGVDEGFTNTDGDTQADCVDPDDDNDGYSDSEETDAGSDPLNENSTPEICDGIDNDLNEGVDEGFANTDGDGQANCVDADDDNDGQTDADETACGSDPVNAASKAIDIDGDNRPDCVDADDDNDGVLDSADNCPLVSNSNQTNTDGDAEGDACDVDDDGDSVLDALDNCPLVYNPTQADSNHDGIGDVCDSRVGPPANKEQCKNDGWRNFDVPRRFKNQGECIQFVNTSK